MAPKQPLQMRAIAEMESRAGQAPTENKAPTRASGRVVKTPKAKPARVKPPKAAPKRVPKKATPKKAKKRGR